MMDFKFDLGQMVRDKFTPFQGKVMARTEFIDGTRSYGILVTDLKVGKLQDWEWLAEERLEPENLSHL